MLSVDLLRIIFRQKSRHIHANLSGILGLSQSSDRNILFPLLHGYILGEFQVLVLEVYYGIIGIIQ